MFLAHGWIYRADGIIQWSGGKRLLPFGQWVFDKSRLIRAIRVQKINGPEEKICESEIRVL